MMLSPVIKSYLSQDGVSLRKLAKELDCDHTTLHRFSNGGPSDSAIVTKLVVWLLQEPNNKKARK